MYYSRQLFEFVKAVLFVIPVNIFGHLNEIAAILSTEVKELEVRISKEIVDYSNLAKELKLSVE